MKIIANVTMFYLPATFVYSLFGTNFVALNTNTAESTVVVSTLWWMYSYCICGSLDYSDHRRVPCLASSLATRTYYIT